MIQYQFKDRNRTPSPGQVRIDIVLYFVLLCIGLPLSACNRAVPEKSAGSSSGKKIEPLVIDQESQTGDSPADALQALGATAAPSSENQLDLSRRTSPETIGGVILPERSSVASTSDPDLVTDIKPGVHIEMTEPASPPNGAEGVTTADGSRQDLDAPFMQLKLPETSNPQLLITFLVQCDRSVQDLTALRLAQRLNENEFRDQAKRLSNLKLQAAERLLTDPKLTAAHNKAATAARVESLSQLTGLGDVDAAQRLQQLAVELSKSSDHQLAHQGKLVLLGFRLNQLQEGQVKDPQALIADLDPLFERPDDRGLVELMALQQCAGVLSQLGYGAESKQVIDRIVHEYRNSSNQDLSMRAWALETNGSAELTAFYDLYRATIEGTEKDPAKIATSATALFKAFPSVNTLAHCCRTMLDLEFSGNVAAASELARVIATARQQVPVSSFATEIDKFLESHNLRLAALGKPLVLDGLVGFDGRPFDWATYRDKVVLVCFWASLELNSMEELKQMKQLREDINDPEFEIVGINLDDAHMSNAEQTVAGENYKWRNVRSSSPDAIGFNTPAARALGVNAIPFLLLVDRSGTVVHIHTRAGKSAAMIRELLNRK